MGWGMKVWSWSWLLLCPYGINFKKPSSSEPNSQYGRACSPPPHPHPHPLPSHPPHTTPQWIYGPFDFIPILTEHSTLFFQSSGNFSSSLPHIPLPGGCLVGGCLVVLAQWRIGCNSCPVEAWLQLINVCCIKPDNYCFWMTLWLNEWHCFLMWWNPIQESQWANTMWHLVVCVLMLYEPPRDKTKKMACAPSKDAD